MKLKRTILFLLLAIVIIAGGFQVFTSIADFFSKENVFAKSNNLEIEYWVEQNSNEIDDFEDSNSLLSQLRSQNQDNISGKQEDIEKIDNAETESKKNRKSTWDKLLEKNKNVIHSLTEKGDKKDKKNKNDKDLEIEGEQAINRFQEEINKSREKANKGSGEGQESKSDKTDKDKKEESPQEKEVQRKKAIAEAKKEKERQKKKQKQKDKDENIVTMHIRCDTAVAKGMANEAEWQGIVPQSGVILPATKFKIKDGDTALDVLKMAKDQYKFQMKYSGNEASAYIEGINNLYEFDGGRWSGWMYSVNDWYPNYGAGVYVLKGGDVIEWNYTCNLGKDLGQEWLGN